MHQCVKEIKEKLNIRDLNGKQGEMVEDIKGELGEGIERARVHQYVAVIKDEW